MFYKLSTSNICSDGHNFHLCYKYVCSSYIVWYVSHFYWRAYIGGINFQKFTICYINCKCFSINWQSLFTNQVLCVMHTSTCLYSSVYTRITFTFMSSLLLAAFILDVSHSYNTTILFCYFKNMIHPLLCQNLLQVHLFLI